MNRSFTNDWFQRKLQDGSAIPRNWLLYSVKNDAVHCFQRLQSTKVRYSKNRVDFGNGKNATKEFQNMKRVSITVHHFLHGKILRDAYQKDLRLTE